MLKRVAAVQYIRRMSGGAQAHLLGCSDGERYVVKFQNNPQGGVRILANELFGTALAKELGLLTPVTAVVDVAEIYSEEMTIQLGRSSIPCSRGLCFGSQYPSRGCPLGVTLLVSVYDLMPNVPGLPTRIVNIEDFAGMLVFDKWTCNTDGRQVIFVPEDEAWEYRAWMIDNAFCFNAGEWNFPDAPLRGLYSWPFVYKSVTGLESFEPWLERLEQKFDRQFLEQLASEIPAEWYSNDKNAIVRLVDQLERRRERVPELLLSAWRARPLSFPNWPYQTPRFFIDFRTDLYGHGRSKAKSA